MAARKRSPHSGAIKANGNGSIEPKTKADAPTSHTDVPQTSIDRLTQNLQQEDQSEPPSIDSDTVLYLAYGSNLCAETFRGRRGIRPLSEVNVSVPVLRFTLSLPGVPYQEPCFANVDFRKVPDLPEKPKIPDMPKFPNGEWKWDGSLVGVVYEVTKDDWREIMRTEGGGSGYKEIVVPCIPLPKDTASSEKPTFPDLPRPVLARTLYAPYVTTGGYDGSHEAPWWRKWIVGPHRPDPDYAQASARYLKLITDGAKEHDLPDSYQDYLQSLQPYTITSKSQQVGRFLLLGLGAAPILSLMWIAKHLADENGRYPLWMAAIMNISFNAIWKAHDCIFKPIFGDGERAMKTGGKVRDRRLSFGRPQFDEEITVLLEDQASHLGTS